MLDQYRDVDLPPALPSRRSVSETLSLDLPAGFAASRKSALISQQHHLQEICAIRQILCQQYTMFVGENATTAHCTYSNISLSAQGLDAMYIVKIGMSSVISSTLVARVNNKPRSECPRHFGDTVSRSARVHWPTMPVILASEHNGAGSWASNNTPRAQVRRVACVAGDHRVCLQVCVSQRSWLPSLSQAGCVAMHCISDSPAQRSVAQQESSTMTTMRRCSLASALRRTSSVSSSSSLAFKSQ